ncbi:MAG: biotin carboxylase N-terminal domain-containing protein [Candidatus Sericytochromatia bacterium]|nr:biotin carboxylase N-terminal domain-containing protein [Candidatus Sericytochromatia bacterium]
MRIVRACRELNIETVAIYTDLDRDSRHIHLADQAFSLGERSYLEMDAIWEIAQKCGADALHPGYGFLAENAHFARGTVERGLAWIGPNANAIEQMGSKLAARKLAIAHDVPIVPGETEPVRDAAAIQAFATKHGYPILIKATAGGGGRGQVVLHAPADIEAGFERAQREGLSYFGDPSVYVERFLTRPRHIEVQVIADKHGTIAHLGERDCTIQRRNQKLVEEAPSPAVNDDLREKLGQAACRLAQAVGYDSVGTCEFMVEDGHFYFLEMNTRIQVEHTVTEVVYRCDLVKEMIRIAAGLPLDEALKTRTPEGWAIQVRLNAEDPSANYRPTPGYLSRYVRPEGPGVRLDGAAYEGWTIPSAYDSMIAKLITWGSDRSEAIARMRRALKETIIEGVPTTLPLHQVIMDNAIFAHGDFSTRFLQDCLNEAEQARIKENIDPTVAEGPSTEVTPRTFSLEVNRQRFEVILRDPQASLVATVPVHSNARRPAPSGASKGRTTAHAEAGNAVKAPMMSRVVKVCVAEGESIAAGQLVAVVEAMKMESELHSPQAGVVERINCQAGDTVQAGQVIVSLK